MYLQISNQKYFSRYQKQQNFHHYVKFSHITTPRYSRSQNFWYLNHRFASLYVIGPGISLRKRSKQAGGRPASVCRNYAKQHQTRRDTRSINRCGFFAARSRYSSERLPTAQYWWRNGLPNSDI